MVARQPAGADDRAAVLHALRRRAAGAHRALPGRRSRRSTYYQLWHDVTHAVARRRAGCASRCARWRATSAGHGMLQRRGAARAGASRARARRAARRPARLRGRAGAGATRDSAAVRLRPDHWLLIEGGRIVGAQADGAGRDLAAHDHARPADPARLHRHPRAQPAARRDRAATAPQLLDWLDTYTFPAEQRYADPAQAAGRRRAVPRRAAGARHDRGGGLPDRAQGLGRRAVRRRAAARHAR